MLLERRETSHFLNQYGADTDHTYRQAATQGDLLHLKAQRRLQVHAALCGPHDDLAPQDRFQRRPGARDVMAKAKGKAPARAGRREEFAPWHAAAHLKSPAEIATYLGAMIDEGGDDPEVFALALGTAARAYGILKLSKKTGISRTGLYKALAEGGNPSLDTVLKVTSVPGVKPTARAAA